MKRLFLCSFILSVLSLCLWNCAGDEDPDTTGSIYGVITDKSDAEPMRATGVELYHNGSLLLKTVTYDDGHYEFNDLAKGDYVLKVVAESYSAVSYNVVVEDGRTARCDMMLEKVNTFMTVKTLEAIAQKDYVALKGSVYSSPGYSPIERGFIYATHTNPANGGTKITTSTDFITTVNALSKGTYYVRAYAKNSVGIEYGGELSFQISGLPSVITLPASNIDKTTATVNARIEYPGDPTYIEKGFVYSNTFQNPTIEDDANATTKLIISGTSTEFSANLFGLITNKTYYVRAYALNEVGCTYGDAESFTAADPNTVVLLSSSLEVQKQDISTSTNYDSAHSLCINSRVSNKNWRLPTRAELSVLYNNRNNIGGFAAVSYWSSESAGSTGTIATVGNTYIYQYGFSFSNGAVVKLVDKNYYVTSPGNYYLKSEDKVHARCVRTFY